MHKAFAYWKRVGADVPYFFPVSAQHWQTCLLQDELDGERVFDRLETYLATENGQVLGLAQWGQPHFAWDEHGQKHTHPQIGVIRHLYFEEGRSDVGEALLAKACGRLASFARNHAFYHILGMSCNAHHGKLHRSQSHVERLLLAHGFEIEHENAYYVLDMKGTTSVENPQLQFCSTHGSREKFEIRLNAEVIGTAQVRYMDALTGGHARDTAYLTWIGVAEPRQRQGIGTELLMHLVQFLSEGQVRYLHTDTAGNNVRAQQFYERLGFQQKGYTRSYVQA